MSIKSELEMLRGESIGESHINLMSIPCKETSDPEKLCKHPLVSVEMITYLHEAYIRDAIEGVVNQETDFEYELIIGEDCSPDKTREICLELQKKHPDKIRVLWADVNVYNLGGNQNRCHARVRGDFIAYCEGDDYWTDPYFLQKQVNAMRANPTVGFCFARAKLLIEATGEEKIWDRNDRIPHGLIKGSDFFRWHTFGRAEPDLPCEDIGFIMTATVLVRRASQERIVYENEVFDWQLLLGDSTEWLGLASMSDVYYLPDVVATYRVNAGGICSRRPMAVCRDAQVVRLYWIKKIGERQNFPMGFLYGRMFATRLRTLVEDGAISLWKEARQIKALPEFALTTGIYRKFVNVCSLRWVPVGLLMKLVAALSLIRRRLFSDMSK